MQHSRLFLISAFIVLGVASRLFPHPPNFTAMNSIALLGTFYLGSVSLTALAVGAALVMSDLLIGMYPVMHYVYFSFGVTALLGATLKSNLIGKMPIYFIVSSLLFFLVTNFGEWAAGSLYPRTAEGLQLCYLAGIPFIKNQVLGDLFYSALIIGGLSLKERLQVKVYCEGT